MTTSIPYNTWGCTLYQNNYHPASFHCDIEKALTVPDCRTISCSGVVHICHLTKAVYDIYIHGGLDAE